MFSCLSRKLCKRHDSGKHGMPAHPAARWPFIHAAAGSYWPHIPSRQLTLLVPKPQVGLLDFVDSFCGPVLLRGCAVPGPGLVMPYACFSCSLLMKVFLEASRVDLPKEWAGSDFLLLSGCLPTDL